MIILLQANAHLCASATLHLGGTIPMFPAGIFWILNALSMMKLQRIATIVYATQ